MLPSVEEVATDGYLTSTEKKPTLPSGDSMKQVRLPL